MVCALPLHPGRFEIAIGKEYFYDNVTYDPSTHHLEEQRQSHATLAEVCVALKKKHQEFFDQIKSHQIQQSTSSDKLYLKLILIRPGSRRLP